LDERVLQEEASTLCEKIKKNSKLEDVFVVILSEVTDKEAVRIGYEKGCDEWITKAQDVTHLARLLSHHLNG
jgi:DNA-binding response OmpR family regulator